MPKSSTEISTIKLPSTKNGVISVAHIEEPYGHFSSPVVSIAIALEQDGDHEWKVHIPYDSVPEVIKALQTACEKNECMPHRDKHYMDLGAEIGGGQ